MTVSSKHIVVCGRVVLQFRISDFGLRIRASNRQSAIRNPQTQNQGFTLLEIILSLAILAGALATLGEVMRLADRNASLADDETQAQILAASVMDELAAGSRELTAAEQVPFNSTDDPPWLFSIAMDQTAYDELVAVRVRVEQKLDAQLQPAHFELTRWMPNPNFIAANATDQTSTSSTSTTGSTSSSITSGSGGGQK